MCVSGYPTLPRFSLPTLTDFFNFVFYWIPWNFPYFSHVKILNKIKNNPTDRPFLEIPCNLKHTYFFFGVCGGGGGIIKYHIWLYIVCPLVLVKTRNFKFVQVVKFVNETYRE